MKVVLGRFARSGIEAQEGEDLVAGVEVAIRHYTHRVRSRWDPVAPPRFLGGTVPAGEEIELEVEPDAEATLEREALRHHVSVEEMLAHAVFTYLVDRDVEHEVKFAAGTAGMR